VVTLCWIVEKCGENGRGTLLYLKVSTGSSFLLSLLEIYVVQYYYRVPASFEEI